MNQKKGVSTLVRMKSRFIFKIHARKLNRLESIRATSLSSCSARKVHIALTSKYHAVHSKRFQTIDVPLKNLIY